ncbi:SDR family NAD(P)-dependent oxidoreductase [Rhodobacter calidifons]|uniref:SDR family oxidoreductase n=1 Tax=Rhodobacter calidifons TaxID=2715277 RepID=A0ABX0G332_9RHOB|nr:SDR family oxidoreductase [Rhodobacter calidifons]NHB75617.1 SDR family oxidoreductase [Rhodobacter calidifons]
MTVSGLDPRCGRVLITGGGTGVGADLARGFAEAGAEVVICGRREAPLRKVADATGAHIVLADVSDEARVQRLFAEAGRCDVVIANAGAATSAPFGRTTLEDWNAMIAVNLTGVFLTFRAGLAQFGDWGRLIAVASTAGLKGYPYVAPYAAAKHGVVGLVRSLALEVARKAVTVNALCPGFLDTEMTDRSVETIVGKTGMTPEAARQTLADHNPQRRLIQPAEVTSAALWLCSAGTEGINGQTLAIAGGEA